MTPTIKFEDHVGLVHLQAKRGFKWADGAKSGLTYDDMFQEASYAFVVAANGFNPDMGLKFSAYYTQVAFSMFRKAVGQMTGVKNLNATQRQEIENQAAENERRAALALPPVDNNVYGIRTTNFSELGSNDDGEGIDAVLDSGVMTPEEIVEFRQEVKHCLSKLSPVAQLIVEWLQDPPQQLLDEINSQMAYADKMEELGKGKGAWRWREGLCISNVAQFLRMLGDIPKSELALAERELMNVMNEIEGEGVEYGT